MPVIRYRAKCHNPECRHEWTSHADSGTPNYCPRCRKREISMTPLVGRR